MMTDDTNIEKTIAELKELLEKWRGLEVIDLDFSIYGNSVKISANFIMRA